MDTAKVIVETVIDHGLNRPSLEQMTNLTSWQSAHRVSEEEFRSIIVDYLLGDIDISER